MNNLFGVGARLEKSLFSSVTTAQKKQHEETIEESAFFESLNDEAMLEAISQTADIALRSDAAAAVLSWIDAGDSEADAFDAMAFGLAGGNDTDELTDEQSTEYSNTLSLMADFAMQNGATEKDCQGLVDGDDDAAERVFDAVETAINASDESELIADFAHREKVMTEALKRVVRNGKLVMIHTGRRKRIMTAVQKSALKKARLKSHSAAGRNSRMKAMRLRKSRGLSI